MTAVLLGALIALYFLPSLIAGLRHHRQGNAIFVLNLFLGWTLLGWVVALVWGLTSDVKDVSSNSYDLTERRHFPAFWINSIIRLAAIAFLLLLGALGFAVIISRLEPPEKAAVSIKANSEIVKTVIANDGSGGAAERDSIDMGAWQTSSSKSKIDDSTNVHLILEQNGSFVTRYGHTKKATLHILCRENRTDLYVNMDGEFLADSGGFGDVIWRVGSGKAQRIAMTASTDHEALGLWNGSGISAIKGLMKADHLLIEIVPYNESPAQIDFNVRRLEDAIKPLRNSCNW